MRFLVVAFALSLAIGCDRGVGNRSVGSGNDKGGINKSSLDSGSASKDIPTSLLPSEFPKLPGAAPTKGKQEFTISNFKVTNDQFAAVKFLMKPAEGKKMTEEKKVDICVIFVSKGQEPMITWRDWVRTIKGASQIEAGTNFEPSSPLLGGKWKAHAFLATHSPTSTNKTWEQTEILSNIEITDYDTGR